MSKPQVASEPTLEEILASIRKMISDDKVGPMPVPDQMGRTPFGEHARSTTEPDFTARTSAEPVRRPASSSPSFNSLADALKVATALTDQRRSLQQEIADAVEKGPRTNFDALSEVSATRADVTRSFSDARSTLPSEASRTPLPNPTARRSEPLSSPLSESKRDLLSFDFGAVVPNREEAEAKPSAESKPEQPAESRVLHLRTGLAGGTGMAGPNVAPFPRPVRETAKPSEPDVSPAAEKAPESPAATSGKPDVVAASPEAELQLEPAAAKSAPMTSEEAIAQSEALLDAVVELVQHEPGAMSVFTSGASFISGIGGCAPTSTALVEAPSPAPAPVEDAGGAPVPAEPGKVDRAAADLLRPMLRQWLSENMGRILEEALRNELSEQTQGGKGPGKT